MRLFIAIEFDRPALARLQALQAQLRRSACRGTFPPQSRLHLTLAFLGEVDGARTERVRRAVAEAPAAPVSLLFTRMGRFGDLWWAAPEENGALTRLQGSLEAELRQAGFPMEHRAFYPHVTLGRRVRLSAGGPEGALERPFQAGVERVTLFQSVLSQGGAEYTRMFSREKNEKFPV